MKDLREKYREIGRMLAKDAFRNGLAAPWLTILDDISKGFIEVMRDDLRASTPRISRLIGLSPQIVKRHLSELSSPGCSSEPITPAEDFALCADPGAPVLGVPSRKPSWATSKRNPKKIR